MTLPPAIIVRFHVRPRVQRLYLLPNRLRSRDEHVLVPQPPPSRLPRLLRRLLHRRRRRPSAIARHRARSPSRPLARAIVANRASASVVRSSRSPRRLARALAPSRLSRLVRPPPRARRVPSPRASSRAPSRVPSAPPRAVARALAPSETRSDRANSRSRADSRDPSSEFSPLARPRAFFAPRVARTSSTARARAFRYGDSRASGDVCGDARDGWISNASDATASERLSERTRLAGRRRSHHRFRRFSHQPAHRAATLGLAQRGARGGREDAQSDGSRRAGGRRVRAL